MLKQLLKKISPAYVLQVLGVIFLFSFAGVSSVKETTKPFTDAALPLHINKETILKNCKDSLNTMWKTCPEISR